MPRNLFEHEMSDLKGSLVDLGHLIDTIIADTLQMLRQPNPETAAAVARREETVNTMERRIEDSCVNIIALQQPLARDRACSPKRRRAAACAPGGNAGTRTKHV